MSLITLFHVLTGSLGLLSGVVALAANKGSASHVRAGMTYWYSMNALAASGTAIAVVDLSYPFVLLGVLSLYLVNTGRAALRRPAGRVDLATRAWGAVNAVCLVAAVAFAIASLTAGGPVARTGLYLGIAFYSAAFLAADWRLVKRGHALGMHRLVDHLWRMMVGMLFGASALFIFNAQVFPDWIVANRLHIVPVVVLLPLLAYWIARVRGTRMSLTS